MGTERKICYCWKTHSANLAQLVLLKLFIVYIVIIMTVNEM